MANKIFIILLFFSFQSFARTGSSLLDFLESKTDAAYIECSVCEKDKTVQFLTDNVECFKKISSSECRNISSEDRKTCIGEEDDIGFSDIGSSDIGSLLYRCIKDTLLSYKFIFDLLIYAIEGAASWVLDSGQGTNISSVKNYVLTELFKAYLDSEGNSRLERILNAAVAVGGQALNKVWTTIADYLQKEYRSFQCYKPHVQLSIACTVTAGFILPGAGVGTVLKAGSRVSRVGRGFIKTPITATRSVKQKVQINSFTDDVRSYFSEFKTNVLEKSDKLVTNAEKQELQKFIQNVNRDQFIISVKGSLDTMLETGRNLTRKDIKNAVIASLTVGTAVNVTRLSQKQAAIVAEGLTDTLATKYVSEEIVPNF